MPIADCAANIASRDMAHALGSVLEDSDNTNGSAVCSGDPDRESCYLSISEVGEKDAIAAIRIIVSCLSILGAISIIFTAVVKRQVSSPKVHPIFVISVADLMLAMLWVVAGILWFRQTPGMDRAWCFAASLSTVILECVTVNLILIYALLAYSTIKQSESSTITLDRPQHERVWHPFKTFLAYFIAWTLPLVIFIAAFAVAAGRDHIVRDAGDCSCWCRPTFGNIIPFAYSRDEPTAKYIYNIRKIIAFYGWVVGSNYLVVFIFLMAIYYKALKRIRRMKADVAVEQSRQSEETQLVIQKGESRARKRVVYFLSAFLFTGFFNVLLSFAIVLFESKILSEGPQLVGQGPDLQRGSPVYLGYEVLLILQSITVPSQGFLNAIVYGWTREDFVDLVSVNSDSDREGTGSQELLGDSDSGSQSQENSGLHAPVQEEDYQFTHTLSTDSEEDD